MLEFDRRFPQKLPISRPNSLIQILGNFFKYNYKLWAKTIDNFFNF